MDTLYFGIDHHKRYSVVCVMNHCGDILWEGSLSNEPEAFVALKDRFPGVAFRSVLEASRNWGLLFDVLEDIGLSPVLAHSYKVRLIADSRIKTDKIDARALASLLRANLIPAVHVPPREVRRQKNLLRQRQWLVQEQTRLKNRIHCILDRHHIPKPDLSDLFGLSGRVWMNQLALPDFDQPLLNADLQLLDQIVAQIKQTDAWIKEVLRDHPYKPILSSLPGIGSILTSQAALEIFDIHRFASVPRFVSYCGLAVSTYSSGGKTYHGHLIPQANRHLRYVFIEAAWSAVRTSPYFAAYFRRLCRRLARPKAIVAVARKLCVIAFQCLKEQRPYEERPYDFRPLAVA